MTGKREVHEKLEAQNDGKARSAGPRSAKREPRSANHEVQIANVLLGHGRMYFSATVV